MQVFSKETYGWYTVAQRSLIVEIIVKQRLKLLQHVVADCLPGNKLSLVKTVGITKQ